MKISPNQIRVELKEIAEKHLQTNSFFWGDLLDAVKLDPIIYPLVNCYYPSGSFQNNTSTISLIVQVSDKLYKDSSNLNDTESDTLQMLRDIFNVINKSARWKRIGKIQNATVGKFKWGTADELIAHTMTLNFILRDVSGVCDLPMVGYDFDQDVPSGGCPDARVINSSLTFDEAVAAGSILELSDITYDITNSEGTTIITGTEAAQTNVTEVLPDINFTDSNGVTTQEPSGKDLVCTPAGAVIGLPIMKTGQTTSYVSGDDGETQEGREVNFTTLNGNNPFGNTNRFTDTTGGQTYTNTIVIDWSTYNQDNGDVLGYQTNFVLTPAYTTFANSKAACDALTIDGFSDWRQCNWNELFNVCKISKNALNYAPFNYTSVNIFWCSNTLTAAEGLTFRPDNFTVTKPNLGGNSGRPFPVRTFNWNGTILT